MAFLGRFNRLKVTKLTDHGAYLKAGWMGEVLLPNRYLPESCQAGDVIAVFVYVDSSDRFIATTQRPKAQVGEVAMLRVEEVNRVGAFLDWGLPKQLLVPFHRQQVSMKVGQSYLVYLYVDEESNRIAASSKLHQFIGTSPQNLKQGDAVDLNVADKTDLGYACVINHQYWGLLFHSDVVKPLKVGQRVKGYVKRMRPDGKVDLSLQAPGYAKVDDLSKRVLRTLEDNEGYLPLSDKSAPQAIYDTFGVSKKSYKMTIGSLYKQRRIRIETDGIYLLQEPPADESP